MDSFIAKLILFYTNIFQCAAMKQIEMKLHVLIHKIKLQIKFPCSLQASLKIDNEEISFGKEAQMQMGEALFENKLSPSLTVLYDSTKEIYSHKKITLLVFLKSTSSLISAGTVLLNLNSLSQSAKRFDLNIQKCPDKDAIIEASLWFQKQSEIDCQDNQGVLRNKYSSASSSSIIIQRKTPTQLKVKQEVYSEQKSKINISNSRSYIDSREGGSANQSLDKQGSPFRVQNNRNNSNSSSRNVAFQSGKESAVNVFNPAYQQSNRPKNNELERQYRNLQKKYDQQNLQLKSTISRRDIIQKSLKEAETQLKLLKEKYEDTVQQSEASIKKMEFKQNSNRQQIKSLNDKLANSEIQKQKLIFEKNDLVNTFEERERTLRLNLRQKQKTFTEEKNKLQRKLDSTSKQFNDSRSSSLENESMLNELTKEIANEKIKSERTELQRIKLVSELQHAKADLLKQKNKRQQLEQNLQDNAQLEDTKKKLKKKITEQESQIERLNNATTTLDANSQRWQRKSEELQTLLKEKTSSLKASQKQNQNLSRDINNYKTTIEQREKKIEELTLLKQNELSKASSLTDQIRQLEKKYQEQLRNSRQQGRQKDSAVKMLNEELQKAKLALSAFDSKNEKLQRQRSAISNQADVLQLQIQKLNEAKSQLQDKNNELLIALQEEQQDKDHIKYTYEQKIIDKETIIANLENEMRKLESNLRQKDSNNSQEITDLNRKIQVLQKQNQELIQKIKEVEESFNKLSNEKQNGSKNIEELKYDLKLKTNQLSFLKESVTQCNQQISEFTTTNKQLSLQIDKLKKDIQLLEKQRQNLNKRLKEAESAGSSTTQKLQQYRIRNKKSLIAYLNTIKGGTISFKPEHEQKQIVQAMQTAISNNNKFANDKEDQISTLTAELDVMSDLNSNTNQQLSEALSTLKTTQNLFESAKKQFATKQKQLNENIDAMQKNIQELQQSARLQQAQFSNNESQISKKYQTEITNLQAKINDSNSKLQDLNNKLNDSSKQAKQNQKKNEQKAKSLNSEIDKLKKQSEQNKKQIQLKAGTIEKYEEISQTLKNNLQKSKQQNNSLKEAMENIRKRNEKGTVREKQLEDLVEILKKKEATSNQKIIELDKTIKEKANQLVASRQNNNKLEKEKVKLTQDSENQISIVSRKFQTLQIRYNTETKTYFDANKQLTQQVKDLKTQNTDVKSKVYKLTKTIEQKQKSHALDQHYLLPIRNNLDLLKGNLEQIVKVGDQFESNKNKLMKMSGAKIQLFSDKLIGEKVRQISIAFQRLKFNLLNNPQMNQDEKKDLFEQFRKVQVVIDRVLRGER